MFTTLMIPVDLAHTDQMEKAVTVAADLAELYSAKAHLVGVTMSGPTSIATGEKEFTQKLESFARWCSEEHGVAFAPVVKLSHDLTIDLDAVLMRAAKDLEADLIVMASHTPGLAEHLFASNAGYLASHMDTSVMVIR